MSLLSDDDSLHGKSWAEICDAELRANGNTSVQSPSKKSIEDGEITDTSADENTNDASTVNAFSENCEVRDNSTFRNISHTFATNTSEIKDILAKCGAVSKNRSTSVRSVSTGILNQSIEEGEIRDSSFQFTTNSNTTPRKMNVFSYAKVVRGLKTDTNKSVVNDDLSLTSHLDIFHVNSPEKIQEEEKTNSEIEIMLDEDTVMFSPCKKEENPPKNMKRPFMLIDSPVQKSKKGVTGITSIYKIAKSMIGDDVHSSTNDKIETQSNDDGVEKNVSSPSAKRELEVNPETLSRRQKQIDYGKNTEGYDRYTKVVPKHKRTKEHPKTPPKHLKMSRRAWDGLIKNWRLKLHKWDSMDENDEYEFENANFDQFSFSSEDPSYCDSSSVRSDSTPSTPKQRTSVTESEDVNDQWSCNNGTTKSESSKELWSEGGSKKTNKSDDDEFLGCEPLSENCVKACS